MSHFPVMLEEVLQHWIVSPSGFYIDCTFGRGGHSRELLKKLSERASLLGIDIDPASIEEANKLAQEDSRFQFINTNYSSLHKYCSIQKLPLVDGILFDLGFSTFQLNDPNRSFSYNSSSSALELKYGIEGTSVYTILNEYSEKKLNYIFKNYGNIKDSKRLVESIVQSRKDSPIITIDQLKELVLKSKLLYSGKNKNPLKLIFQALRIECNNELENFKRALEKIDKVLKVKGKLLIITFQSLEDEVINEWKKVNTQTLKIPDLGVIVPPLFKLVSGSPFLPSRGEIESNWPSRSAKLWVFTKER